MSQLQAGRSGLYVISAPQSLSTVDQRGAAWLRWTLVAAVGVHTCGFPTEGRPSMPTWAAGAGHLGRTGLVIYDKVSSDNQKERNKP